MIHWWHYYVTTLHRCWNGPSRRGGKPLSSWFILRWKFLLVWPCLVIVSGNFDTQLRSKIYSRERLFHFLYYHHSAVSFRYAVALRCPSRAVMAFVRIPEKFLLSATACSQNLAVFILISCIIFILFTFKFIHKNTRKLFVWVWTRKFMPH